MIDLIRKFRGVLLVLAMLLPAVSAKAQTTYGAMRGLVKDTQGAVIAKATVVLTNEGTNIIRTTETTADGEYYFRSLDPGQYTVSVVFTGFKKTENKNIRVELGATATIDISMSLGGSTETVEVNAAEPLIDTATANGGQSFDSQQLTDLPNLGRNPFVFEKMDVAVTPVGDPRYVRAEDQTGQSTVSIAGAPIGANNYAVDGIPISQSNGGVTFIPSLEAVSDVKVQANTYDAEVGRAGGGLFNTSLKSGTDQYHGVLYGVTRQTNWSANPWINNRTPYLVNGVQVAPQTPRPDVTTYLYAGAFGGPLPFMHKVKYLDKTFFWVTEEGYRQAQPLTGSGSLIVPTPAQRAGDFSALIPAGTNCNVTPVVGCIYNPTTSNAATGIRTAFPGNIIPASYLNAIGTNIASRYPACTLCSAAYGQNNYFSTDDFKTRSDMYSGKLDHTFSQKWSGAVSYVHLATQEPSGNFLHIVEAPDSKLLRYNDATATNQVIMINPTTVLTAGYGFNRYYSHAVPYSSGFNQANGFGGAGFPAGYASLVQSKTFPSITVNGIGTAGGNSLPGIGSSDGGPTIQSSKNVVVGLSKSIGKQNLKIGYVYRHLSNFSQPLGSSGAFTFSGQYTSFAGYTPSTSKAAAGAVPAIVAGTGNGIADLLLGFPGNGSSSAITLSQVGSANFNMITAYHSGYLQDDFRATNKLTLNLGIRYEYEPGQKEENNKYAVGFDKNISYTFPCATATVGTCAQAHGGLVYAGQNGYPVHCCDLSKAKFSPRIGAAYEVNKGTVVRGGFGVFYSPFALVSNTTGYSQTTSSTPIGTQVTAGVPTSGVGASAPLANPFGGASNILQPSGNSLTYLTSVGSSISAQDFSRKYPVVLQYSFNLEQALPGGSSIQIGYIGSHSRNFPQNVGVNQISDGQLSQIAASGGISNTTVNNPYYTASVTNGTTSYPSTGTIASSKVAPGQLILPYPQFPGGTGVTLIESVGYSLYNALTVKFQKRYHGLNVLSTYTWSSNWDNFYGAASAYSSSLNSTTGPQDNYNLKAEYARAVNDIPNRFTLGLTYDLPVGRGKALLGNAPRWLDLLVGGYQVNTVSILQNGSPLTFQQSNLSASSFGGVAGFGGNVQRPALTGANPCLSGQPQGRLNNYFNQSAFAATPAFTYSSMPRTLPCQGPGYANTDLSINKSFKIGERVSAQFRAEALNATNTPEFSNPGLSFTATQASATAPAVLTPTATTGIISGTVGFNRIIQLGGRISF